MPLVPDEPKIEDRTEKIAVNVADLDRVGDFRIPLFFGRLNLKVPIITDAEADNPVGSVAVAFSCELIEAGMIADLCRSEDRRIRQKETRFYLCRGQGQPWRLIPRRTCLVSEVEGKLYLNPFVFSPQPTDARNAIPLPARRPTWL